MWLMMYICYLLMATSFVMVFITGLQGFFQFHLLGAAHPQFALLTVIVYLFTETQIIFFFIGSGRNTREYLESEGGDRRLYDRLKKIKTMVFPHIAANIVLMFVVFLTGGAVEMNIMPGWVHGILFIAALCHLAWTTVLEHRGFKTNTGIILEMCGIEREHERPSVTTRM